MNHILALILLGIIGPQEIIIILISSLTLFLIPLILYLLTLQNTFEVISIENRAMKPGEVWLILIPLFGLVWQFIVVNRLADSLKSEFNAKNIKVEEERPGAAIGLAYCILSCCSVIPFVNFFAGAGGIICWIIYWTKIAGYKTRLKQI